MNKYRFFLVVLVAGLAISPFSVSAASPKKGPTLDRMVAAVNKEVITESELDRQTELLLTRLRQADAPLPPLPELRKQVLERMILEKLQLQVASSEGIDVDDALLNQTIQDIAKRDGLSTPEMQKILEEQGVPFPQFRNTIKTEITLSKVQQKAIGQNIILSPAEVDRFLNSPAGQDQTGAEYRLSHLLLPLPENPTKAQLQLHAKEAGSAVQALQDGGDFAKMAISKSAGQQALEGGDLGWRKAEALPTLFAKVVSSMRVGDIHGPIQDNSGFHIIKLVDKRAGNAAKSTEETHICHILIKTNETRSDTEAEAFLSDLRKQMLDGAKFAALAKKYSEEISSANKGGDIGWVNETHVVPQFVEQIANLKTQEISPPFQSELGWHLIQVLGRRTPKVSSHIVRNKAMEVLYQRKFDELLPPWLRNLRANAEVQIYLNET